MMRRDPRTQSPGEWSVGGVDGTGAVSAIFAGPVPGILRRSPTWGGAALGVEAVMRGLVLDRPLGGHGWPAARALALAPGEVLLRDVQVSYRSGRLLSMTSLKWRPGDGPEIPLQASRPRSWLRHHQHVERLGGTRARGLAEAAGCAGVRGVPCGAAICRLARAKWRGLPSAEE